MNRKLLLLSAFAASLFLGAAAAKSTDSDNIDYESLAGQPVEHIRGYKNERWDQVDDHHIVVYTRKNEAFLITFKSNCRRFDLQDRLVVERSSSLRLYPEDKISINGAPCMIKDLRPLDFAALQAAKAELKRTVGR